jgi:hypothetical protein
MHAGVLGGTDVGDVSPVQEDAEVGGGPRWYLLGINDN